jgi:hypothetical protein
MQHTYGAAPADSGLLGTAELKTLAECVLGQQTPARSVLGLPVGYFTL